MWMSQYTFPPGDGEAEAEWEEKIADHTEGQPRAINRIAYELQEADTGGGGRQGGFSCFGNRLDDGGLGPFANEVFRNYNLISKDMASFNHAFHSFAAPFSHTHSQYLSNPAAERSSTSGSTIRSRANSQHQQSVRGMQQSASVPALHSNRFSAGSRGLSSSGSLHTGAGSPGSSPLKPNSRSNLHSRNLFGQVEEEEATHHYHHDHCKPKIFDVTGDQDILITYLRDKGLFHPDHGDNTHKRESVVPSQDAHVDSHITSEDFFAWMQEQQALQMGMPIDDVTDLSKNREDDKNEKAAKEARLAHPSNMLLMQNLARARAAQTLELTNEEQSTALVVTEQPSTDLEAQLKARADADDTQQLEEYAQWIKDKRQAYLVQKKQNELLSLLEGQKLELSEKQKADVKTLYRAIYADPRYLRYKERMRDISSDNESSDGEASTKGDGGGKKATKKSGKGKKSSSKKKSGKPKKKKSRSKRGSVAASARSQLSSMPSTRSSKASSRSNKKRRKKRKPKKKSRQGTAEKHSAEPDTGDDEEELDEEELEEELGVLPMAPIPDRKQKGETADPDLPQEPSQGFAPATFSSLLEEELQRELMRETEPQEVELPPDERFSWAVQPLTIHQMEGPSDFGGNKRLVITPNVRFRRDSRTERNAVHKAKNLFNQHNALEELKVARSIPEQKAAQKQVPTYKAKMLKLEELQEKVLLPPAYETFRLGIEKWSFPGMVDSLPESEFPGLKEVGSPKARPRRDSNTDTADPETAAAASHLAINHTDLTAPPPVAADLTIGNWTPVTEFQPYPPNFAPVPALSPELQADALQKHVRGLNTTFLKEDEKADLHMLIADYHRDLLNIFQYYSCFGGTVGSLGKIDSASFSAFCHASKLQDKMLTPHEIENAFRASCRQPEAIGVEEEVTTLGPGEFIEAIMRCAKAKYREEIATNRQRFAHMLHKYVLPAHIYRREFLLRHRLVAPAVQEVYNVYSNKLSNVFAALLPNAKPTKGNRFAAMKAGKKKTKVKAAVLSDSTNITFDQFNAFIKKHRLIAGKLSRRAAIIAYGMSMNLNHVGEFDKMYYNSFLEVIGRLGEVQADILTPDPDCHQLAAAITSICASICSSSGKK